MGRAPATRATLGRALAAAAALVLATLSTAAPVGAAAEPTEGPELTWAPLVTLPPIAPPPILTPLDLADGYSLGASDAPVAIEVWEDFQCPFCQRFTFQVKPALVERFVETGQARLTFRNLAFLGDESHWAAVAGSLAADQDRFWPFHDYVFANLLGENVGSFSLDRLLAIGEAASLDMQRFREGLVLDAARARFREIDATARAEAAALGINATPTVTVDGVVLPSPDLETVSAAVEAALAASAATATPGASPPAAQAQEPSPPAEASASEGTPAEGG
jgi:protein-disulfide isomerase